MHLELPGEDELSRKSWELEGWGNPANGRMVARLRPASEGFSSIERAGFER